MKTKANDTPNWTAPILLLGGGYLFMAASMAPPDDTRPHWAYEDYCQCLDWPVYEGLAIAEYDPELAALIRKRKAAQQAAQQTERTWQFRYAIGDAGRRMYAMGENED